MMMRTLSRTLLSGSLRRRLVLAVPLASLLAAPLSAPLAADEVSLFPAADNTLYEDSAGSLSNGAGSHLFTGFTKSGELRRGLLRFDLAGAVPAGSTIEKVRLTMHLSRSVSGGSTASLHRVEASWGEGASAAASPEGAGGDAQVGDATWIHREFDSELWATPGGDFVPEPSASVTAAGSGYYTWDTTERFVADVRDWLADPATNHGWILIGEEGERGSAKRFDSRENPDESRRPRLLVTFTPPAGAAFLRGDANFDGNVDISDALRVLGCLFLGQPTSPQEGCSPDCAATADSDGSGVVNVTDPILLLNFLFLGGRPLAAPFPECGGEPEPGLGCATYPPCL